MCFCSCCYPCYHSKKASSTKDIKISNWSQVISSAVCTDVLVSEETSNAALNRFLTQLLDGYDLLILEAMDKAGVTQIITDDGDYVTVPGIKVFTANSDAIAAAKSKGKLLVV